MSALGKQIGGDHYKGYAIQPIEFCQRNKLGFIESCVIKRMCRWQAKDGIKDLRKAIHEIELLIELTEAAEKRAHMDREAREKLSVKLGHPRIGDHLTPGALEAVRQFIKEHPEASRGEDLQQPVLDAVNRAPAPSSSYPPIVVPEGAKWPVGARNGTRILAWRPRKPGDLGDRAYGWVEIGFMWNDVLVRYDPAS